MTIVLVTKPFRGYNAGEVAGFPPAEAAALVEGGFASPAPQEEETKEPKPKQPKEPKEPKQPKEPKEPKD